MFRPSKRVIHFDTEIAHGAFDPGVAEKQLDCSQVAVSPTIKLPPGTVDTKLASQRRLR